MCESKVVGIEIISALVEIVVAGIVFKPLFGNRLVAVSCCLLECRTAVGAQLAIR